MKISPTGKGSVQYGTRKYAQQNNAIDGPQPVGGDILSPETGTGHMQEPPQTGESMDEIVITPQVKLMGSTLVIHEYDDPEDLEISIPLSPDQVSIIKSALPPGRSGGFQMMGYRPGPGF